MRNEDAIKKKIGNLIDSMLCDDSQISEMDNTKNKTEAFDIDEFVLIVSFAVIVSEGMSM